MQLCSWVFFQEVAESDEMLTALLENTVPELQTKLCAAGMASMASLDKIYQIGRLNVHRNLQKKEAQPALVVLANLVRHFSSWILFLKVRCVCQLLKNPNGIAPIKIAW